MNGSFGLLGYAAFGLFVFGWGTGCVNHPQHNAASEPLRQQMYEARARAAEVEMEAQMAALRCREAAVTREADLVQQQQRDLVALQQMLQKVEALTLHNAELTLRLQKTEASLAENQQARASVDLGPAQPETATFPPNLYVQRTRGSSGNEASERELLRNVQALIDSGHIKATVYKGRVQFHLPRQLDATDPYQEPAGAR